MQSRWTIRRLKTGDLVRILEIERASFGAEAYDRNLFAEFSNNSEDLFLVAECNRNTCGYMIASLRGSAARAELVSVAVDPGQRGAGAASALMESTLRRLRRRGATRIGLIVKVTNEAARAFYKKYGFRQMRRVSHYYEDGSDGWLMSKPL